MSITIPAVGTSTKQSLIAAIINDVNSTSVDQIENESNATPQLINGSFEDFAEVLSVNVPLNWTQTLLTGGAFAIDQSVFAHGITSVKFTSPGGSGNGGGYIQSTDLLPLSPYLPVGLQGLYKSDTIGTINRVRLYWFNSAGNACTTPYSELIANSSTPNTWTSFKVSVVPPTMSPTASYCQVRLVGCDVGSPAGNTWFDGIQFYNPYADICSIQGIVNTGYYNFFNQTTADMNLPAQSGATSGRTIVAIIFNENVSTTITITCSGTDKFSDGTTTKNLASRTLVKYYSDGVGNWYVG